MRSTRLPGWPPARAYRHRRWGLFPGWVLGGPHLLRVGGCLPWSSSLFLRGLWGLPSRVRDGLRGEGSKRRSDAQSHATYGRCIRIGIGARGAHPQGQAPWRPPTAPARLPTQYFCRRRTPPVAGTGLGGAAQLQARGDYSPDPQTRCGGKPPPTGPETSVRVLRAPWSVGATPGQTGPPAPTPVSREPLLVPRPVLAVLP